MNNTFNHESALHGARVWCGEDEIPFNKCYISNGFVWYESPNGPLLKWRLSDGKSIGCGEGIPPLTTESLTPKTIL